MSFPFCYCMKSASRDFLSRLRRPCEASQQLLFYTIIFGRKVRGQMRNFRDGSNSEGSLPERRRRKSHQSWVFTLYFLLKQTENSFGYFCWFEQNVIAGIKRCQNGGCLSTRNRILKCKHLICEFKAGRFCLSWIEMKWDLGSVSLAPISFMFDCFAFNMGQAAGGWHVLQRSCFFPAADFPSGSPAWSDSTAVCWFFVQHIKAAYVCPSYQT